MLGTAAEIKVADYVAYGYCTETDEVVSQKIGYNLVGNAA